MQLIESFEMFKVYQKSVENLIKEIIDFLALNTSKFIRFSHFNMQTHTRQMKANVRLN